MANIAERVRERREAEDARARQQQAADEQEEEAPRQRGNGRRARQAEPAAPPQAAAAVQRQPRQNGARRQAAAAAGEVPAAADDQRRPQQQQQQAVNRRGGRQPAAGAEAAPPAAGVQQGGDRRADRQVAAAPAAAAGRQPLPLPAAGDVDEGEELDVLPPGVPPQRLMDVVRREAQPGAQAPANPALHGEQAELFAQLLRAVGQRGQRRAREAYEDDEDEDDEERGDKQVRLDLRKSGIPTLAREVETLLADGNPQLGRCSTRFAEALLGTGFDTDVAAARSVEKVVGRTYWRHLREAAANRRAFVGDKVLVTEGERVARAILLAELAELNKLGTAAETQDLTRRVTLRLALKALVADPATYRGEAPTPVTAATASATAAQEAAAPAATPAATAARALPAQTPQPDAAQLSQVMQLAAMLAGARGGSTARGRGGACFLCGKVGHFAKQCHLQKKKTQEEAKKGEEGPK